jgi:hypothetical protein
MARNNDIVMASIENGATIGEKQKRNRMAKAESGIGGE